MSEYGELNATTVVWLPKCGCRVNRLVDSLPDKSTMENTWASGAIELLRHADSHIDLESAFDKRIAFISIDNCLETLVRTFLSLPGGRSGVRVPRRDVEAAEHSFPKLVDLLFEHAEARLMGIDPYDIEHYHRIRNRLYHEGTGLSVDDQYLLAYRSIAEVLLQNLFGITYSRSVDESPRLDTLILNYNRIQQNIRQRLRNAGIDDRDTYKWEQAFQANILTFDQVQDVTELGMARNRLAHSSTMDAEDVAHWVRKSKRLLNVLESEDQ